MLFLSCERAASCNTTMLKHPGYMILQQLEEDQVATCIS